MSMRVELEERECAFQNRLTTFRVKNVDHEFIEMFFDDAFAYFEPMIESLLDMYFLMKISTCLHAIFEKKVVGSDGSEKSVKQSMYLHSSTEIVDFETNLKDFYSEYVVNYLKNKITEVELRGSGFTLDQIVDLEVQTASFDPYNGASYIKLPKKLENRKAVINVQNDDNLCFKWALLSALYPATTNAQRVSKYKPYKEELNFTGVKFPVGLKEVKKFEELNPTVSVNVYMWNEAIEKVRPLRLTKKVKEKHVHLLLLTEENEESDTPKTHYCYIKNLSALIGR